MAIITSLYDQQLVEASSLTITNGVPLDILTTNEIANDVGTIYNSIRVTTTYEDLLPSGVLGSFFIGMVVESKDPVTGVWSITNAYQFNSIRADFQPLIRVVIMQPNMDTFNLGTDDSVVPLDAEICRISRAQGTLPESKFRIKYQLQENDKLGANAFVSVKVSSEVEQYNV